MPIVGFTKQGTAKLKTPYGPKLVGIINIRTSEREAAPQDNLFWYELIYEESIMRAFKRLSPVKFLQPAPKDEMVNLERKPQEDVIPAPQEQDDTPAGIRDENNQEVNPYLLTGDELARTEEARKAGRP